MKKKMDTNHWLLEWLAFSFFALGFIRLLAGYFNVNSIDFDLMSFTFMLIGVAYYIAREIYRLEPKPDHILMEENEFRVYFNTPEDETVTTELQRTSRHINSEAEWFNGKILAVSAPVTPGNEYPRSMDASTGVIENGETGILIRPEIIDFKNYFSVQEDRPEEKINKKFLLPVEPAGPLAGKEKTNKENRFQKEAMETLEEYKHFFNHSSDLICVVKPNGTLFRLNPNFEKTLGYSKNELLGKHFITFVHPEDIKLTQCTIDNLGTKGGSKNFINRYLRKDGGFSWLEWNLSAGSGSGKWCGIARDITDRKKAECDLNHLNEQLDQKVFERTQQLETANQELEAFTYSVSHDLRAPLRALSSYAHILEEDYLNLLDEEGKRILLVIRSSAEKMGTLIDDLLAFSRLGNQSIQKTKVDLNECARVTLEELQQVYKHKASIHMQPLPIVYCDGALIRQVLSNLLDNAIKYSSKKENPVIELFARQEGQEIVFCVSDNGTGFDMRYVQKLFGVFERLHTEKEYEGTGVGLAIADRIITKHGGTMWAESILGKGAAFYFSLPVAG